jgi:hypothetical protein
VEKKNCLEHSVNQNAGSGGAASALASTNHSKHSASEGNVFRNAVAR